MAANTKKTNRRTVNPLVLPRSVGVIRGTVPPCCFPAPPWSHLNTGPPPSLIRALYRKHLEDDLQELLFCCGWNVLRPTLHVELHAVVEDVGVHPVDLTNSLHSPFGS